MSIHHIHAYLVHPNKRAKRPREARGTDVSLNGRLFDLLDKIYRRSNTECDIDITFRHASDGRQQNECRDLVREYVRHTTLENGRELAERLAENTDRRSGLGLLFLIAGRDGNESTLLISRFPTDVAIYVDEDPDEFSVEFLERVFMKNKESYKAVVYRHSSLQVGFWKGRATDRQLNRRAGEASNYWILDFLASQLTVTPAAGTRRLATAMSRAAKKADLAVKQEINAAAILARGLAGQTLSVAELFDRYDLSQEARLGITAELPRPTLSEERFEFSVSEFEEIHAYRSIELSNGGILTAQTSMFDDVFQRMSSDHDEIARFVTEGRIVNERLRSTT